MIKSECPLSYFAMLLFANFSAFADCNKPSINGEFCRAVEAALNNDAGTKFAQFSIEKNLFEEIRSAFHDQHCDKDKDNLGHCQAALSFKENQCGDPFGNREKETRYHMKLICNTFVYAENGGVCENLKVMTTNSPNINSAELAGMCEGYQSTVGIVPAIDNALEIKQKIQNIAGKLAASIGMKVVDHSTKKPISAKRKQLGYADDLSIFAPPPHLEQYLNSLRISNSLSSSQKDILSEMKMPRASDRGSDVPAKKINFGCTEALEPLANYAVIPYQKQNYERVLEWLEKTAKKELHLVVGSARQTMGTLGSLTDRICNFENADLSHRFTFSGKATSMDLSECAIKGLPHIVADARTYDFSKYIISSVLFEKFSTRARDGGENNLGKAIENIAKSMKSGAIMEIEWLPETTLSFSPDHGELAAKTQANPFHGFLNAKLVFQSFQILGGGKVESLEAGFYEPAVEMAKKIRKQVEFYCRQGIGKSVDELVSLLSLEAKIILEMVSHNSDVLINYYVKDQDIDLLRYAHEKVVYKAFVDDFIGTLMPKRNHWGLPPGIIYNLAGFMEDTFLNFVVEDMVAKTNRVYVLRYLESLAFGEVSIEKGNNPHNGRKNAWMIRATKL